MKSDTLIQITKIIDNKINTNNKYIETLIKSTINEKVNKKVESEFASYKNKFDSYSEYKLKDFTERMDNVINRVLVYNNNYQRMETLVLNQVQKNANEKCDMELKKYTDKINGLHNLVIVSLLINVATVSGLIIFKLMS